MATGSFVPSGRKRATFVAGTCIDSVQSHFPQTDAARRKLRLFIHSTARRA